MSSVVQLQRGMLLRDLQARTLDARAVQASDFRGRRNLVLVFPGDGAEESALLDQLRRAAAELQEEEAVVLIADPGDNVRQIYGAIGPGGSRIAALYITDRYGEIYFAAHSGRGEPLPGALEVLDWLRYINSECPE